MKKKFCYLVVDSYGHVLGVCDSLHVAEQLLLSEFAFDDKACIKKRLFFTSDDFDFDNKSSLEEKYGIIVKS